MWAQVHSNEVVRTMVHPIEMEVDGVKHPKSIFTKWKRSPFMGFELF